MQCRKSFWRRFGEYQDDEREDNGADCDCRFAADLQAKRDLLGGYLIDAGFTVFEPEGTYFTTVDISTVANSTSSPSSSIEFCLALPETAGVVAVPSAVFYQDRRHGEKLVRFCFAKNDEMLIDAGGRLVTAFG